MNTLYELWKASKGLTTDTRAIEPGQIFLALKGETFNGNEFALKALEAGAAYAVVDRDSAICLRGVSVSVARKSSGNTSPTPAIDGRIIVVDNTLQALKELAAEHRRHLDIPVIGLTGTNGKTTTKELIREVLSRNFRVSATKGNLNNDIGVPLTVLSIPDDCEIAVVEMGANHPEDIAALTWVSQPTFGVITNVGKAHLEGFGSFEGVKHAKSRLYDWLSEHDGQAFVNVDSPDLFEMATSRPLSIIPYGIEGEDVKVLQASAEEPFLRMVISGHLLETHLVGAYNAANVMAAVTVGQYFGVSLKDAIEAIAAYEPSMNRSQLKRTEHNTVIEDAYNANPSSMKVALDNLEAMAGRKVALLGEMRELGADSVAEHAAVVERLAGMDLEQVCLVGEEFEKALECRRGVSVSVAKKSSGNTSPTPAVFKSSDDLAAWLDEHPVEGCTVLVKGSRGTRMEKVLPKL